MRRQINLQKRNTERNIIFARGKIIEVNRNYSTLQLFIRNGAGRKHTYLKFKYDSSIYNPEHGQHVLITGHLENRVHDSQQYYIADSIKEEKTELSNFFFKNQVDIGFAPQKAYAKLFVYGEVINKFRRNNSDWTEIIIKDNLGFNIQLQYSKKMRVSDTNIQLGDNIYLFALPISIKKEINGEIIKFEKLIVEDIVIVSLHS